MILDKKKRIIFFVILSCIYLLFFSCFTFKVKALDLGSPNSLAIRTNYSNGELGNASGYRGWDSTEMTKFKISDDYNTEQDFEYNVVANYSGQASYRAKGFVSYKKPYYQPVSNHYFVFSVYSRTQLDTVNAYVGDEYSTQIGNITCRAFETVSSSDSPHYFYNFNCNTENINRAIYEIGVRFHNDNDVLYSPINFGISNFYSFDTEKGANDFFEELTNTTSNLTNEDVNDINNILSPNVDNIDSQLGGFQSSINGGMKNTPVSGLISLPITFLTGVSNAISTGCQSVRYIELYDYQLILPCLNLSERLGNVWVIIDSVFSLMLIYSIGKSLVVTFARLSDMDTNIMYECYSEGMRVRGRREE